MSALLAWVLACGAVQEPPIEKLIDELAELGEEGLGFSNSVSGGVFLPLQSRQTWSAGLLGQPPPAASSAMREIVKRGAAAVPALVARLGDARPTRIVARPMFGGLWFADEYDYNSRTTPEPPENLNRASMFDEEHPKEHTITVGDLCFVALGQIVNRSFSAMRYQPTAIVVVNSTSSSDRLRGAATREWAGLTPERHRASLVADFQTPDNEGTRNGAAMRLAYYYPQAAEEAILKVLALPRYDVSVCEAFARKELYPATPEKWKAMMDGFVSKHGEAGRDGLLRQLLGDLDTVEASEEGRLSPPLKEFQDQPRRLLKQFYPGVRTGRRVPHPYPVHLAESELARLVESIVDDRSEKVDRAVRELLVRTDDWYLAVACAKRLTARGYDEDLASACARLLRNPPKYSERELREAQGRIGWTRLHVAAQTGRREEVVAGTDVDARAKDGRTALHVAVSSESGAVVEALLGRKADVEARDGSGRTALQLALEEESFGIADLLLGAGASLPDVNAAAYAGDAARLRELVERDPVAARSEKAFLLAVTKGHLEAARVLIRKGADAGVRAPGRMMTPLHLAAQGGGTDLVEELLAAGADVRAKMHDGYEPLHLAAFFGHREVAQILLGKGADVDARETITGGTPLHWAAEKGNRGVLQLLLERKADRQAKDKEERTPLQRALEAGDVETVKAFSPSDAELRAKNKYGQTGLHLAAGRGAIDLGRFLVDRGVPFEDGQNGGEAPLQLAAGAGHLEMVRLLLDRGARVDRRDSREETALVNAAECGEVEIVALLLSRGADKDDPGLSAALHRAVRKGQGGVVKALLARNAGPDVRARYYDTTPLQEAAWRGRADLARLLLDAGAAVDVHSAAALGDVAPLEALLAKDASLARSKDRQGRTPLEWAARGGRREAAEALLRRDASAATAALGQAARRGHVDVVKLLIAHRADVNARDENGRTLVSDWGVPLRVLEVLRGHGARD